MGGIGLLPPPPNVVKPKLIRANNNEATNKDIKLLLAVLAFLKSGRCFL